MDPDSPTDRYRDEWVHRVRGSRGFPIFELDIDGYFDNPLWKSTPVQ